MTSDGGNNKGEDDIVVVISDRMIVVRGSTANALGCSASESWAAGSVDIVEEIESRLTLAGGKDLLEDE